MTAVEPYLRQLRELPFIRQAAFVTQAAQAGHGRPDGLLRLETSDGDRELFVALVSSHLSYVIAEMLVRRLRQAPGDWVLFVPYVGAGMAEFLGDHGVNYVDRVGNCRLVLGPGLTAIIGGRRSAKAGDVDAAWRAPAHQILFALLADPALLSMTVREIAIAAGGSKSLVSTVLRRLEQTGHLIQTRTGRQLRRTDELLLKLAGGYVDVWRPSLLVGRFQPLRPAPDAVEGMLEGVLDREWWLSGGAAAARLTGHWRGERTVVHLDVDEREVPKLLRALPARDGVLSVLRPAGPLAMRGPKPHVVHPLLAYLELFAEGSERSRESADELRDTHLRALVP